MIIVKNYNTKEKILIVAIVIVSVCIVSLLALISSLLLPALFSNNIDQSAENQRVAEVIDTQGLELSRIQRMETLKTLRGAPEINDAPSTRQGQRMILQTLSQ